MKRTIRWSFLMALLGFILGLGFLVPIPNTEMREPASVEANSTKMFFVDPGHKAETRNLLPAATPRPVTPFSSEFPASVDHRTNVLFDTHLVSRSGLAKNTDAYVLVNYTNGRKTEIDSFTYCHNYDYSRQAANPSLNRYAAPYAPQAFTCDELYLSDLADGYAIIDAGIFGRLLMLQSKDFNPLKGGTISILYAYKIGKLFKHEYRALKLKVTLQDNGGAKIEGPGAESFDWITLKMTEDFLNLPSGVNSFEFYKQGGLVKKYPGVSFPKVTKLPPKK